MKIKYMPMTQVTGLSGSALGSIESATDVTGGFSIATSPLTL